MARRFGALNLLVGLLGFVGPLVRNDDDGLVNTAPGLFLGAVAVNGRHAALHVGYGLLGLAASRDAASARGYMGLGAAVFGTFAAVGWRVFGFERGVHLIAGFAVDWWGNLAHAVLAAFGLSVATGSDPGS